MTAPRHVDAPRSRFRCFLSARSIVSTILTIGLLSTSVLAQSPWKRAAANLEASFTGPLARSLALVAIVLGGLMFMFGEAGAPAETPAAAAPPTIPITWSGSDDL